MAVVGDGADLVAVGDYVCFRFDRSSRSIDKSQSNYRLPLHVGKITKLMDDSRAEVWWMFGEAWDRHWYPWRDRRSRRAYKEIMKLDSILLDSHGVASKLTFITRRKLLILDRRSQAIVQEILAADGYSTSANDE
jgi:hypothetical protein